MAELTAIWQNHTGVKVDRSQIEEHLNGVLRHLIRVDKVNVEIVIITDKEIKTLKQRFFDINESTDVLSFPSDGVVDGLIGSIVVSVETALRQAKTAKIKLVDEIKMLTGHGLLHLLGYSHR